MKAPIVFTSPAPIEIVELPWLDKVAPKSGAFGVVGELFKPISWWEDVDLYELNHLRDAAVRVGNISIAGEYVDDTALITVRSGLYSPKPIGPHGLDYHFDIDPAEKRPAESCQVATGAAGNAAVGRVEILSTTEKIPRADFAHKQARAAQNESTMFDLSGADIVPLKPNVLYFFPRLSVHDSPGGETLYPRSTFRIKEA